MAFVTLFDHTSISPNSRFFYLDQQLTIVGIGLPPGDYITFEVVESNPATRARNCGCDLVPPGKIALAAAQVLVCPSCKGTIEPIKLTPTNPVVILDHPQGFFIRAVYHGNGLQQGSISVRAFDSNTPNISVEMRGCLDDCCEDDNWVDTLETRCRAGIEEVWQRNGCGDYRWEPSGEQCYLPTLDLFCGARAFRPTDHRDPEATVALKGCCDDEEVIGYIYPTPREGASTAVTASACEVCDDPEVLGYAVDWPNNLNCCSC